MEIMCGISNWSVEMKANEKSYSLSFIVANKLEIQVVCRLIDYVFVFCS